VNGRQRARSLRLSWFTSTVTVGFVPSTAALRLVVRLPSVESAARCRSAGQPRLKCVILGSLSSHLHLALGSATVHEHTHRYFALLFSFLLFRLVAGAGNGARSPSGLALSLRRRLLLLAGGATLPRRRLLRGDHNLLEADETLLRG